MRSDKQLLFERMSSIGGAPEQNINEVGDGTANNFINDLASLVEKYGYFIEISDPVKIIEYGEDEFRYVKQDIFNAVQKKYLPF